MESIRRDLREILDVDDFQKVQRKLSANLGVTLLTFDNTGELIGEIETPLEICRMIHAEDKGKKACIDENCRLVRKAVEKNFQGCIVVKDGFHKIILPVLFGRKTVGFLIGCGIRPFIQKREEERKWFDNMIKKAGELGFDSRKYLKVLRKMKPADQDYMDKLAGLLGSVAEVLSRIGYFTLIKRSLMEKKNLAGFRKSTSEKDQVKTLASRLSEEENIERLIIKNISDGIIVVDADNRYRMINPKAEEYLNINRNEVIGNDAFGNLELVFLRNQLEDPDEWRGLVRKNYNMPHERTISFIKIIKPVQRTLKRISIPLDSEDGTNHGRLIVLHDITRSRRSDEMRENLISMVSHELRTPLTSIKGALNIIRESPQAEIGDLIKIAARNCDRLVKMVENILDVSRFRFGKVGLSGSRIDLYELAENARNQIIDLSDSKKVEVILKIPESTFYLMADRLRMEQVLVNFLQNAVKHSPQGSRVVILTRLFNKKNNQRLPPTVEPELFREINRENTWIRVTISDQGPGISPGDVDRIFDPFYQSDMSLTRKSGGLGLGLTLCQAIIEEHGGRVWCESQKGLGSQFIFELPCEAKIPVEGLREFSLSGSEADEGEQRWIMIVDDDKDLVEVISATLQRSGYRPLKAYSGLEALSLAEKRLPWAIILDIRMPEMDGYEVLEKLKNDPCKKGIPVIMITAGGEDGRKRAEELGASAYFTKPFEEEILLREIEKLGDVAENA